MSCATGLVFVTSQSAIRCQHLCGVAQLAYAGIGLTRAAGINKERGPFVMALKYTRPVWRWDGFVCAVGKLPHLFCGLRRKYCALLLLLLLF